MASFSLECPRCGTINTASTSVFARRRIQCIACGEEIHTKHSRMIAKTCPKCKNQFVFDQHLKEPQCPHCGEKFLRGDAQTYRFEGVFLHCPQCGCGIEAKKTETHHACPLCGKVIHISDEYARQQLVRENEVSVISYEGDNNTLIWKHPIEDFNIGSQLIVHESQEAVLFVNGQALDSFGAGRYALDSENIPMLRRVFEIPGESRTPFHCEVYFINKTVQLGLKWGTPDRIRFMEPRTGIPMDLGACGELNLQVANGRKLLIKLVGTTNGLRSQQVLSAAGEGEQIQTLRSFFRAPLVMAVKNHLAQAIRDQQINILEIDTHLTGLSNALKEKIQPEFAEFGLHIPQFYITAVSLPEDDPNFRKMKELIAKKWMAIQETQIETDIQREKRGLIREEQENLLLQKQYELELKRREMQLEAERVERMGQAEGKAKEYQGYSQRDVLRHEEQLAYAQALGQIGANGGSGGGGLTSDLLGLSVGLQAAGALGQQVSGMMAGFTAPAAEKTAGWTCQHCGETHNTERFCVNCGKPKPETWTCSCGKTGNTKKFCGSCGKRRPETWTCSCGQAGNEDNFCESCGSPRPAE